jgi:ADP-heptose:LPS heptosyltransferase
MSRRDPQAVLVIKTGPLREFVLAAAAMREIRATHPDARITLLTSQPFQGLARPCPYVDVVETDGDAHGAGPWLSLVGRLRGARYERVYDLQADAASNAIRLGMAPLPPPWFTVSAAPGLGRRSMHPLDRQADALRAAGAWTEGGLGPGCAPPPDMSWIVRSAPTERPVPGANDRRPNALFIPSPSETPAESRWPAERYGELGLLLRQRGFDVVIVGYPQDGDAARAIQRQVPGARDLTGAPDYVRVGLLAARATVAIGADSSFLHLAVAAGAPGVVLCPSASDPALSAPRGHVTVLQAEALADLPADSVMRAVDSLSPAGARSA